jgi:hypothetical protein
VALDSASTDSDTGSDSDSSAGSPSSTDTIDTTVPDCALRRRRRYPTEVNGVRGLPPGLSSSHLTVLCLFTFVTPTDAASPTAVFNHWVQSHKMPLLSFLGVTILLVLNNLARSVRRSTTVSATCRCCPRPLPYSRCRDLGDPCRRGPASRAPLAVVPVCLDRIDCYHGTPPLRHHHVRLVCL